MKRQTSIFLAIACCISFIGCSSTTDAASTTAGTTAVTTTPEPPAPEVEKPVADKTPATASSVGATKGSKELLSRDSKWVSVDACFPKDGEEVAVLDTVQGEIVLMFFPDIAPGHVKQYKSHFTKGVYNGTYFHRVMQNFMIQGGDPNTKNDDPSDDGSGGAGAMIPGEFNNIDHEKGVWSTARTNDPNSAQSQFFICNAHAASLNGQYTVFGKVISGLDVVDKITALPCNGELIADGKTTVIKSAKLVKWPYKVANN